MKNFKNKIWLGTIILALPTFLLSEGSEFQSKEITNLVASGPDFTVASISGILPANETCTGIRIKRCKIDLNVNEFNIGDIAAVPNIAFFYSQDNSYDANDEFINEGFGVYALQPNDYLTFEYTTDIYIGSKIDTYIIFYANWGKYVTESNYGNNIYVAKIVKKAN